MVERGEACGLIRCRGGAVGRAWGGLGVAGVGVSRVGGECWIFAIVGPRWWECAPWLVGVGVVIAVGRVAVREGGWVQG